jgi:transposase
VEPIKKGKGIRIMVWGAIWALNKSDLLLLERDYDSKKYGFTSDSYIKILEEIISSLWDPGLIFMQDNALIYISKKSRAWFDENSVKLLEWSPYSLDLNPIENLWFPLKEGVYNVNPDIETTIGGEERVSEVLGKAVIELWSKISSSIVDNCIMSIPRRLAAVRAARGWYTGY